VTPYRHPAARHVPRTPRRDAVRPLARVDPERLAAIIVWLESLPFDRWPQQHRLADGQIRPAMVNDPEWYGFGARTFALVNELLEAMRNAASGELLEALPGTGPVVDSNRMLSCVMPGHSIPEHADEQEPAWLTRVHVPLTTNDRAVFVAAGLEHHLEVGWAYLVDTRVPHAIRNDGPTPRVHFMFDVRRV